MERMKPIGDIYNKNTTEKYYETVGKNAENNEKSDAEKLLESLIPQNLQEKVVLDLGCGNGRHSEVLCERGAEKVVAIDLSESMIEEANARKIEKQLSQLELVRADMDNLPIGENKFDFIFSRFSLMYSGKMEQVVSDLSKSLVAGGEILVETSVATIQDQELKNESIPLVLSIGNKEVQLKNFAYTMADYMSAFEKAGLKVVVAEQFSANDLSIAPEYEKRDEIKFDYAIFRLLKEKSEKNVFQPFPFEGGFEKKKINEEGERAQLSSEKKEQLDIMIAEVAILFEGSDVSWAIDGGLSVSLLRGEYIGEHRDLDVAVENSQLEKLQKLVESKGFGLFATLNAQRRETMVMKRVDAKEFSEAPTYLFWIVAVDEEGLIQKDKPLSFINVHKIRRNEQGLPLYWGGEILPAEWFESKIVEYQGKTLNLAHPAKTAYYKLRSLRNYDVKDLEYLVKAGELNLQDIETIEKVLEKEPQANDQKYYTYRRKVIEMMKGWLKE